MKPFLTPKTPPPRMSLRRYLIPGMILALVAVNLAILPPAPAQTSSTPTDSSGPDCVPGQGVRILFLLDTSGSLVGNDPEGNRIEGTRRAIYDLATRARNDGLEQRQKYSDWTLQVAVDTFDTSYIQGGAWEHLVTEGGVGLDIDPVRIQQATGRLERVLVDAAAPTNNRTDYREALGGALERFHQGSGADETCNLLFWFTDGAHDTEGDTFTSNEQAHINDLCLPDGVMDNLAESKIWTSVIELTANRNPTALLPRLIGTGTECEGLSGQTIGQVHPVSTASELVDVIERVLYEVWPRTALEYSPCSPSEQPFRLSDNLQEVHIYIDLTRVEDPGQVALGLKPPGGVSFPISFGDGWRRIEGTGFIGWKATRLHREIRAHQISEELYQTTWGDDQVWHLVCSGLGHEEARIAIDQKGIENSRVVELNRTADNLLGRVEPPPREEETVLISVEIGGDGPGSGRIIDLTEEDRRVELNGRFTISGISGRVEEALSGTGECQAEVDVSVTKWVAYGQESRFWDIPGSTATRTLDICTGPLAVADVLAVEGRPYGPLQVVAQGGYLDSTLSVDGIRLDLPAEIGGAEISQTQWECQVPADAVDYQCGELPVNVSVPPHIDREGTLTVTMSAWTQNRDLSDSEDHVVPGFPVRGLLPHPDSVEIRSVGNGAVEIRADGGLGDALMEVVDIRPDRVRALDDQWFCSVPSGVGGHVCVPGIQLVSSGAEQSASTTLDLTLRVRSTEVVAAEWEKNFSFGAEMPGNLPSLKEEGVTPLPREPDEPITLQVEVEPGATGAVLYVEKVEPVEDVEAGDEPARIIESSWKEWRCPVTGLFAGAEGTITCDPLHIEWETSRDTEIELRLVFRVLPPPGEEPPPPITVLTGPFELRVWELEEFLWALLRLLALLVVVVVVVRFISAWIRRRWAPLPHGQGYFDTLTEAAHLPVGEGFRSARINPEQAATGLTSANGSAMVGGMRLKVLWWPLLLRGKVEIGAFNSAGDCVSRRRSRSRRGGRGRYGVVGSSLRNGWAMGTVGDNRQLLVWDLPPDQSEAQARLEDVLTELPATEQVVAQTEDNTRRQDDAQRETLPDDKPKDQPEDVFEDPFEDEEDPFADPF